MCLELAQAVAFGLGFGFGSGSGIGSDVGLCLRFCYCTGPCPHAFTSSCLPHHLIYSCDHVFVSFCLHAWMFISLFVLRGCCICVFVCVYLCI